MITPRPHQTRTVEKALAVREDGGAVCCVGPTGCGKSLIMQLLALHELESRGRVALYTHRKMLVDQMSEMCLNRGIYHGIRAAGYPDERDHPFQICSIQTEYSRCIKKDRWKLHDATLVLVDEAHLQSSSMAREILKRHREAGAFVVGFTATPLDLGDLYGALIEIATMSEMIGAGVLVDAVHYAPDEPDLRRFSFQEGKDLTEKEQVSAMARPGLWGRIFDNFIRLNPDLKPTICFGPSVAHSVGLAQQFSSNGVRAAHMDGEHIWVDGRTHPSTREFRQQILEESRNGSLKVLCNRFLLREGIDCPWLAHAILACVFGSLQSYLQSGGRLLRSYPGLSAVTIQDHGGNFWRHDPLTADRIWTLGDGSAKVAAIRAERLRRGQGEEPFTCPACGRVWQGGTRCNPAKGGCGTPLPNREARARTLVTNDGKLVRVSGPVYRPRKPYTRPDGPRLWEKMYWRARNPKWDATFAQARAKFAMENYWQWPQDHWPLMPKEFVDNLFRVRELSLDRLTYVPESSRKRVPMNES